MAKPAEHEALTAAITAFKAGKGGYKKLAGEFGVKEEDLRAACRVGQTQAPKAAQQPDDIGPIKSRAEWLHAQLLAVEAKSRHEKGSTAFTALIREARIIRGLLDEAMAVEAEAAEAQRLSRLTSLPPEERRTRLRERADALALDDLEVFVRAYIDRHGGRVELQVKA